MTEKLKKNSFDLDALVESQLNLQVKISYSEHHDFMIRHQLKACERVLDVGTGNASFVGRLAEDHPEIRFVGIDKRKHCVEAARKLVRENLEVEQVDMFSRASHFDFSVFDGFLMRYFLLHVDYSKKILELLKTHAKRPTNFWIIDLDFSKFACVPQHPTFDKFATLVTEFCEKTSIDSLAGQRVLPMLQELRYQNIVVEHKPFSALNVTVDDLALYLKQEVQCYSRMSGRSVDDPETAEIVRFIEDDVKSGKVQVSYGMILLFAELRVNA